jgi:hypothetical protein
LVQVLMLNDKLDRATRLIQSFFRMRKQRKQFLLWHNRRVLATNVIIRSWKSKRWQRLIRDLTH